MMRVESVEVLQAAFAHSEAAVPWAADVDERHRAERRGIVQMCTRNRVVLTPLLRQRQVDETPS